MIVGFDFEDGAEAVADIDDAGVFTGALDDAGAGGGEAFQVDAGGFIGAVLAPHDAEDAELGEVGVAAEDFLDAGVLVGGEAVFGGDLGGDFEFGRDHAV